MVNPYMKAPHADPGRLLSPDAPNAALLIDFDNVTMGMRSDLAKELKHLLESDIIKGKVTVQRAYADWRRYPQYIVPLSEASIDLIFAPAYGSSKKNATDIRMAIDGMELVFIRPEIGTFILLTGDSDFSSLVLKLKEYGKYVIGIGIQESSSDILVQNCDEYYSYTALTGLSKTTGEGPVTPDAWECVEEAVGRMASRGDVMRSDRLKQVIMELAPGFDERSLGFKNFSKFLVEAANKGLVKIQRGENGQYKIAPPGGVPGGRESQATPAADPAANGDEQKGKGKRGPQARRPAPERGTKDSRKKAATAGGARAAVREPAPRPDPAPALSLLVRAVKEMGGNDSRSARDSDVKRKMLAIDRSFNESAFGFGKFSKFLLYAEEKGAIALKRGKGGSFGIVVAQEGAGAEAPAFDAKALGLPTAESAIKSYLAHRYKGVGVKTAERLVDHFGTSVFEVLQNQPERVKQVLFKARAESVLANWAGDYKRRSPALAKQAQASRPAGQGKAQGTPAVTGKGAVRRGRQDSSRGPREGSRGATRPDKGAGASPDSGDQRREAATAEAPARTGLLGLLPWGRRSREPRGGGD